MYRNGQYGTGTDYYKIFDTANKHAVFKLNALIDYYHFIIRSLAKCIVQFH